MRRNLVSGINSNSVSMNTFSVNCLLIIFHQFMNISESCTTDRNCAANEVCQNGKCLDPCSIKGSCGLNAICSVQRHRKQCVCPQDFTGNPEVECVRIPSTCYSSTDCPQPLQCSDGICMPSCTSDESCALNERCLQGLCMRKLMESIVFRN